MAYSPKSPAASSSPKATGASFLEQMARPPRLGDLGPIAARFAYALRLIALHDRARRDPVPELAARMGGVEIAAKALVLAQAISSVWPEDILISRFCCQLLTHDEATIGAVIDAACARDRAGFEAQLAGLIRPERVHRLWDGVLGLIAAEANAA
ncbi:MAG: DNA-directed RNA polymerase subunit beta' [Pseudomonadota bacterium]